MREIFLQLILNLAQMKVEIVTSSIKFAILAALFFVLPPLIAIIASVILTVVYPYVVAAIYGVKVMPSMD